MPRRAGEPTLVRFAGSIPAVGTVPTEVSKAAISR
nr:MAG TPA: hypothetical protein [Caudoviricetes sp.]